MKTYPLKIAASNFGKTNTWQIDKPETSVKCQGRKPQSELPRIFPYKVNEIPG